MLILKWLQEIVALPNKREMSGDLPLRSLPKDPLYLQENETLETLLIELMHLSEQEPEAEIRLEIASLIKSSFRTRFSPLRSDVIGTAIRFELSLFFGVVVGFS